MGAKEKQKTDETSKEVRAFVKKLGILKLKAPDDLISTKMKKVYARNKFAHTESMEFVKNVEFWKVADKADMKSPQFFRECDCWFKILNAEFDMMLADEQIDGGVFVEIEKYISNFFYSEVQNHKGFNDSWRRQILNAGTKQDIITASASLIERHAMYNIAALDELIKLSGKFSASTGSRSVALQAIDSLFNLWIENLLPDRAFIDLRNRPLVKSHELASGNFTTRNKILGIWYFEQLIRQRFDSFLCNLESFLHDTVHKVQSKVLFILSELLIKKPHLDELILPMLINKCGDPRNHVGGSATRAITFLLGKQPMLKKLAISEAENLIFRMKQNKNVRHYCISFLNQIVLSKDEHEVAERLMNIYLKLFKSFIQEGTKEDTRILTNILSGIHRAIPFANIVDNSHLDSQINTLYKIVQTTNINTGIQALLILMSLTNRYTVNSRFYMSLYKKMLEPGLTDSKNLTLLFNLLYRSIKHDNSAKRVSAFVKRLLQLCLYSNTPFCTGGLCLLGEVLDPDDTKKRKNREKNEPKSESSEDLEKRRKFLEDSDDEEHFEDVLESDSKSESLKSFDLPGGIQQDLEDDERASLISVATTGGDILYGTSYKPRAVNPVYARADTCKPWELVLLQKQYHLSVQKFSGLVANGKNTQYCGDPIRDFSSSRYIEKFCQKTRKPKKEIISHMAPKPKEFMTSGNIMIKSPEREDYMTVFERIQKEVKADERNRVAEIEVEDMEEVGSDDDDFNEFMFDLEEKEFKAATGGVLIPDDYLPLEFEEGDETLGLDEELSDEDMVESGDEIPMDSDFELGGDDDEQMEDDDLFLT